MANENLPAGDGPAKPSQPGAPEHQQAATVQTQPGEHGGDLSFTLGVKIGEQNWLVDMADISGVLPLSQLAPVPLARPWFLGVVNVRGMLYGVTDMAAYQQKGKASGTPANRILLVDGHYEFNAALLVDCVLGLRNTRAWKQEKDGGSAQYCDEQGSLWRRLDVADLLDQPDFLQIGL